MREVALIALLGLPVCTSSAFAFGDVGAEIDSLRSKNNISAAAYAVVSGDSVIAQETFGYLSHEEATPFNPDSIFRIGSITKTFTAIGALIAQAQGKIDLTVPIAPLFDEPPFENAWSSTNPLTIAHLLEHTGGLHDLTKAEFDFNEPVDLNHAFKVDPMSRVLAWPPGVHSSYSNSGAGVISVVIEQATGQRFATYMQQNLFRPLELTSATFEPPSQNHNNFVAGYNSDGRTPIPYWHQLYQGFGALNISLHDMVKFVQFFLVNNRQTLLPAITEQRFQRMLTPATSLAARHSLTYGYGLGIYQFQVNGISFFGHGGDADGYLAFFAFSPALDRGYFVMINAYNNSAIRLMRNKIQDKLTAHTKADFPPILKLTKRQRDRIIGRYTELTTRFRGQQFGTTQARGLAISEEAGDLYTVVDSGPKRKLIPVTTTHFRRRGQTVATSAIVSDSNGQVFQSDLGNFGKKIR